ncbi:MAG: PulJ/GspJ family protein, partial [Fimbriiglobus sp.]
MLNRFRRPPARRGFTLVELLVAAALSVVIMYILATAFKTGTDTLSSLKSLGTLSDQLRTAQTVLGADLAAPHLEDENGNVVPVSRATMPGYGAVAPSTSRVPWDSSDPT